MKVLTTMSPLILMPAELDPYMYIYLYKERMKGTNVYTVHPHIHTRVCSNYFPSRASLHPSLSSKEIGATYCTYMWVMSHAEEALTWCVCVRVCTTECTNKMGMDVLNRKSFHKMAIYSSPRGISAVDSCYSVGTTFKPWQKMILASAGCGVVVVHCIYRNCRPCV